MPQAPVQAALLAALPQEVRPFLRRVQAHRAQIASLPVWEFPLPGGQGVLALSGVGENAAARLSAVLAIIIP